MLYIDDLKLQYPLDYNSLSRGWIAGSHYGTDHGWNANKGGGNVSVYAPGDGTVYAIQEGMGNTLGTSSWGNYVKIDHGGNVYTLSGHLLKGSINELGIKVGSKVERYQKIGRMNNSGNSEGNHVHFEVYLGGAGTGYRVDPQKHVYIYPDQEVGAGSACRDKFMYHNPIPTGPIGTPVARDESKRQVEVKISDLSARLRAERNDAVILGFIVPGIYDILDEKDMRQSGETSNDEWWVKIEHSDNMDKPKEGLWIAVTDAKWATIYEPTAHPPVNPPTDDKDKEISELHSQNAELRRQNASQAAALKAIQMIVNETVA